MLGDGTAEADIDDLHAFADAEYRSLPLDEELQCLKLDDIQFYVNIFGTLIFLSEEGGSNIAAAREQKAVKFRQMSCVHGGKTVGFHGMQGIFIVDGIFASSYDGNPDRTGNGVLRHNITILSMCCDDTAVG